MPTTAPTVIFPADAITQVTNLIIALTGLITVVWAVAKALRDSGKAKIDAGEAKVMAAANNAQIQGMQQTLTAVALATPVPAVATEPGQQLHPVSFDEARLTRPKG